MRELVEAAQGRQESEWARMSALLAHIANTAPLKKRGRSYTADDFNPYKQGTRRRAPPVKVKNLGKFLQGVFARQYEGSKE